MNALMKRSPAPSISTRPPQQKAESGSPAARLLFAEDDHFIRRYSEIVLSQSGYEVDGAEDGEAAWEALHSTTYDLLITDHLMPRLNGLELVTRMRLQGITVPIIVVSGVIKPFRSSALAWLNVDGTISKPFTHSELIQTVARVLRASTQPQAHPFVRPAPRWGINE